MWKDAKWAVAASLLVAAAVVAQGLYQIPKYEASARVLVGERPPAQAGNGKIRPIPNAHDGELQTFTQTVARPVPTKSVARAVVRRLNLPKRSAPEIRKNTSAEQDPGTMFIDISYEDSSPKKTQQIANAIGRVVSHKVSEMSLGAKRITATVWKPATIPETPVSPKPLRNGLIALVATLVLSAVLIAAREHRRG
jgi:capsular polysaccharide biosynthesis protein